MLSPISAVSFRSNYDLTPEQKKNRDELVDRIYNKMKEEYNEDFDDYQLEGAKGGCLGAMVIACLALGSILLGGIKQCSRSTEKSIDKTAQIAGSDSIKQLVKDTINLTGRIK